jgi:ABC-type amino acid transport substrate-binding protein
VRSGNLSALLLTALLWGVHSLVPSRAQDANDGNLGDRTLSVCLNNNVPPYSIHHDNIGIGFDVAVAEALAKRLGRRLAVQWFESKLDEGSNASIEANALLSDARCALVGGYPLIKDALSKPGLESARLPDFEGARPSDHRRQVTLGTLAPTRPYHFAALTVVFADSATARHITSLADLDGVKLGIEGGTLGDAILMGFDGGRFIPHITHLVPGRGQLLPGLESGDYAATLIAVHRFDAYRADHPETKIRASGYYLPIGFNMAFVGLTSEDALINRANAALDDILKSGELVSLAQAAGMTYLPPREPYVLDHISLHELGK